VTSRERLAVRLLLVAGLPIFAIAYAAKPVLRARLERVEQLAQSRDLLARADQALRDDATLRGELGELRNRERQLMRAVVSAAGEATAVSHISEQVRSLARRHEVLVLSTTEIGTDSTVAGLSLIRLGVRVESDMRGIARLLGAIASDPAALRVSRVFIERRAGDLGAPPGDSTARALSAHLTIEALARVGTVGALGGGSR
jgi:hypothetical protein